jgi:hypothetical protein
MTILIRQERERLLELRNQSKTIPEIAIEAMMSLEI